MNYYRALIRFSDSLDMITPIAAHRDSFGNEYILTQFIVGRPDRRENVPVEIDMAPRMPGAAIRYLETCQCRAS